jgi:hypothetical protein
MAGPPSLDCYRTQEVNRADYFDLLLVIFMRCWGVLLAGFLMMNAVALARADEPLDQLIKRADAAPERERTGLYTAIAERQLLAADQLYNAGQSEGGKAAVTDVVTYSEKAAEASTHYSARLKQTEIALRKMAAKLRDIQRTISFEDQKPVEDAANRLEKLRTDLLSRMFNKGVK